MNQSEWEQSLKNHMLTNGWTLERENEKTLRFSFIDGCHDWIRDYNKKEKTYVEFDGNQIINIRVKNEPI